MPSKSRSQQRLFCMALAVRKGDLERSKVNKAVLDIVDSDMTNKQIEDFTILKENRMRTLTEFINEKKNGSIYATGFIPMTAPEKKIFIVIKPGSLELASTIIDMFKEAGFELFETRTKQLLLSEAKGLYKVHRKEDFYKALCEYMASGPSMGITFKYTCSTKEAFKLCDALKNEIREKYGESDMRNVMHSSDNAASMKEESKYYV